MQVPSSSSYTAKGFFGSLFDIGFSSLIVTRIIKVVYVIAIIAIGLEALGILVAALATRHLGEIIAAIIVIPIVSLVSLIWVRILLELVIIIFRIGEDVRRMSLSPGFNGAPGSGMAGTAASAGYGADILGTPAEASDVTFQQTATEGSPVGAESPASTAVALTHESTEPAHTEAAGTTDLPVAGWYADPEYEDYLRFWDGQSWTAQRRPRDS